MSGHEQFAEDLALYALNALTGEERASLEGHLASCNACRLELEQLRGDGALLALSVMGAKPPARARQRLLDAVANEPATLSARRASSPAQSARETSHPRRSWWGALGWAAAFAVLVFAASLWKENSALRSNVASLRNVVSQEELELGSAQKVARAITDPDVQHFTLVAVKTPPQPQGKAFYLRNRSNLVFLANNMPALPPQKAYELWLIPAQGAPIPAGVFKPDTHGSATVVNPPLPSGMEAKAFAITVENEAGSTVPTSPVVMMGTGE